MVIFVDFFFLFVFNCMSLVFFQNIYTEICYWSDVIYLLNHLSSCPHRSAERKVPQARSPNQVRSGHACPDEAWAAPGACWWGWRQSSSRSQVGHRKSGQGKSCQVKDGLILFFWFLTHLYVMSTSHSISSWFLNTQSQEVNIFRESWRDADSSN